MNYVQKSKETYLGLINYLEIQDLRQ